MLPISLDLARLRLMLVGGGAALRRRLALLDEAGVDALEIYSPDPDPELAATAGARLRHRLPCAVEIARAQLIFVAGAGEPAVTEVCRAARAVGVLVNVEDDRERSDFHSAAVIRRGDLTVAVSTGGRSPGLAALLRQMLERRIGREWELRLDEIAALRGKWRAGGADPAAVSRRTREWVARRGLAELTPPGSSQKAPCPIP